MKTTGIAQTAPRKGARRTGRRPAGRRAALALLRVALCAALGASVAGAQVVREDLQITNGTVNAVAVSGSTLYLGGAFTAVGSTSGTGVPISAASGLALAGYPRVTGQINAVVSDGAGGWFIGGQFSSVGGVARANLAHVLADNSVAPWNPGASGQVLTLVFDGTTLYAGGSFSSVGGESRSNLAAVDGTTGVTTAWDPGASSSVRALALGGGVIYVGGSFTSIGASSRMRIAAVDLTSGTPTSWNPNANSTVRALVANGSSVFVGGDFTNIGGQARLRVAALDVSSGLATAWNPGSNAQVSALALDAGSLYVGGAFTTVGGQPRTRLCSVDAGTGAVSAWSPGANAQVLALSVVGSVVYAGGDFTSVGGQARSRLAALDATTGLATAWNPIAYGAVFSLASYGGVVYAGGSFTGIGGVLRNNLAALDLVTGQVTSWNPDVNSEVLALAVDGATLRVGGSFTMVGAQVRNGLAAFDLGSGALGAWDPNVSGRVASLGVSGGLVYSGGLFTDVGGQPRANIAAIDGATGAATAWNPGTDGEVFTVTSDGGVVYIGGTFTTAGGSARNNIAALDAASGSATAWNPNSNGTVRAIALSCGRVLTGGFFTTIGGQARNRLAWLDAGTGVAGAWNPNSNGPTYDVMVNGRTVYVSGVFSSVGALARNRMAAIDLATGVATAWNPNASGAVRSLALDAGSIYAGGSFASIGATLQTNVAGMTEDATLTCPTITLSPASLPAMLVGGSLNQPFLASGGASPYCWSLSSGSLPPGLAFDPGTGTLAGTATTAGSYAFTLTATDANGCQGAQAYSVQVDCPAIALSPSQLPYGSVGAPYAQSLAASAGNAPLVWAVSSGSLPAGITLAPATGVLSGVPVAAGTSVFTITATDAYGCTGGSNYTLDVFTTPPASVVAANTSAACLGPQFPCVSVPFVFSRADSTPARGISVTFQIDTTRFALCNAGPPGLSIQPGPWLAGYPNSNFQVVSHGGGSYTVDQAIFGVPCGITVGGELFTVSLKAVGPDGPGLLTVTNVKARDCGNLAIAAAPGPAATLNVHAAPVVVLPDTLADAPVNAPYATTFSTTVGTQPVAFVVTAGALPPGVTLATDGTLSGTPTVYGSYSFAVTATDAGGCTGSRAYTLDVTCPVMALLPATLPNAPIGVAYSQTLTADGGTPPVTFAVTSGSLPPGLSLAPAGGLTGTPSATGSFAFTVRATATGGCFVDRPYTVAVACPAMAVLPATLTDGLVGSAFAQSVSASDGIAPFAWTIASGSLPAGLSLDPGTGMISGTPSTAATSVFTLRVTDAFGCTAEETYTLSILASPPASSVTANGAGLCLSTTSTCVSVPFLFARGETAPARGVSVTFQLETAKLSLCTPGSPLSSVHLGTWFTGYTNHDLQVTDRGGGRYTVDVALFGSPCGIITGGQLFTVDVQSVGSDGTGSISIVSAIARDCDNVPIGVLPGASAVVSIQHAAPAPVTDLTSEQVLTGNPPGQTTGITLSWTTGGGSAARLYRAPFGAYPLYDANGPVAPPDPLAAPGAPWTLVATSAATGYVDHPPARGWWQYVAYAIDSCGNLSAVSAASAGALDYHLGDVSDGVTVGTGDNRVSDEDVSLLGANYGIGEPAITSRGVAYLDIGPTTDYLPTSRPHPDHLIDFEDFILFAANYQVTSGPPGPSRVKPAGEAHAASGAVEVFDLAAPSVVEAGALVTTTLRLNGSGAVRGFSAVLGWDPSVVQPVGAEPTSWFAAQDGLLLSPGPGRVDGALLGAREIGLAGDVEVASVTFRAIASGAPGLRIQRVAARDGRNQPVTTAIQVADVAGPAPRTTALAAPWPNPSREATTLEFGLARTGAVELSIYGIDGRRVRLLVQGEREAGNYRLNWDGADDRGRSAAPGVYYARLRADGREFTKKLVRLDR